MKKQKRIPGQYFNKKEVSYVCTRCKLFRLDMREAGCVGTVDLTDCPSPRDKEEALKAVR